MAEMRVNANGGWRARRGEFGDGDRGMPRTAGIGKLCLSTVWMDSEVSAEIIACAGPSVQK